MMAITRYRRLRDWDPFADFYNLADVFADRPSMFGRGRDVELPMGWHPAVDIFESDDDVVVEMDLPGLTKDEIDISFDGHVLTVTGRRANGGAEGACYWSRERFTGDFHRYVHIPADVVSDDLKAKYDHGVLRLTMPKAEKITRKKIAIESGEK